MAPADRPKYEIDDAVSLPVELRPIMLVRDLFDDERVADARAALKRKAGEVFDENVTQAREMWRKRT